MATLTQYRKRLVGQMVRVQDSKLMGVVTAVKQMAEPMCLIEYTGQEGSGVFKPSELEMLVEQTTILGYTLDSESILKASQA